MRTATETLPEDIMMVDAEGNNPIAGDPLPGEEDESLAPPEPDEPRAKDEPWKAELAELRKDLRQSREEAREARQALQTWMQQGNGNGSRRDEPPPEPEPDIDLVEAISSGDKKQAQKAIKQLGFYDAEDVERMVEQRVNGARGAATRDAELVAAYPDLSDEGSELYAATARHYKALSEDGISGPRLLELAANSAAAEMGVRRVTHRGGRTETRRGGDDFDDETQAERDRRVAAQSGPRGDHRRASITGDDELSPMQRKFARIFGVSESAYMKRAKRGLQFGGMGAH